MQQTKKFEMADAISPYLAVSCELRLWRAMASLYYVNYKEYPVHADVNVERTNNHRQTHPHALRDASLTWETP